MTPTPKQNAKRETPRTDAIICQWSESAKPHTPDLAHYRQGCEALEAHAKDLETELQQLRLAADGMRDAIEALMSSSGSNIVEASDELLREAAALVHDTDAANAAKAFLAARQALARYRAAGEGAPKDTGTSKE